MNHTFTTAVEPPRWIDRGPAGWAATPPAHGPYDLPTVDALRTYLDDESWRAGWE